MKRPEKILIVAAEPITEHEISDPRIKPRRQASAVAAAIDQAWRDAGKPTGDFRVVLVGSKMAAQLRRLRARRP